MNRVDLLVLFITEISEGREGGRGWSEFIRCLGNAKNYSLNILKNCIKVGWGKRNFWGLATFFMLWVINLNLNMTLISLEWKRKTNMLLLCKSGLNWRNQNWMNWDSIKWKNSELFFYCKENKEKKKLFSPWKKSNHCEKKYK